MEFISVKYCNINIYTWVQIYDLGAIQCLHILSISIMKVTQIYIFSFNATDIKRRSYLFICQPWPSIIPHCDLRLVRVAHIIKSHIRNTRSMKKQNETINVEKYLQDKAYQITHLRCFTMPIF